MLYRRQWFADATPLHTLVDIVGAAVVLLGLALRLWAGAHIRPWKGKRLVQTGPYAWCRHPLYLGSLLALLGVCTIAQNTPFVVASMLCCVGAYAVKIRIEERNLAASFGAEWQAYCAGTPRLLPRFWQGGNSLDLVVRWRDACAEIPGGIMFAALALSAELAEVWALP